MKKISDFGRFGEASSLKAGHDPQNVKISLCKKNLSFYDIRTNCSQILSSFEQDLDSYDQLFLKNRRNFNLFGRLFISFCHHASCHEVISPFDVRNLHFEPRNGDTRAETLKKMSHRDIFGQGTTYMVHPRRFGTNASGHPCRALKKEVVEPTTRSKCQIRDFETRMYAVGDGTGQVDS